MNPRVSNQDLLGIGLYTTSEAALLLGMATQKLRRWVHGYSYKISSDRRHVDPLWTSDVLLDDGTPILSFQDLIEFRFVKAFTDQGIGLKAVRNCLNYARECIETDRPFSTGRFRTDGQTIFLQSLEKSEDGPLIDLRKRQFVFKAIVEKSFRDLDLEDDIVTRWRPHRGKDTIVIDPGRSFGQPIAEASGVPTITLAEAVEAEGSVTRVARLFEVAPKVVRDAVQYQNGLKAA
ncbi:hypothetical protein AADZ90_018425 [Aestuariibius sp. 2305UL40-4]|uniref:hypothetical protein n=1 Tax=Aestuariibius violaceus TaxID=3234132 RepID=UPI00345EB90B